MIQKTKVLTLIVFGLLFLNLSAQEDNFSNDPTAKLPDDNRKFRLGLQFSPNISWLKANTAGYKSNGTKFGFSYGLSFEYFMSKNYLFSTGLSMLNSGGKVSYKSTAIDLSMVYPADVEVDYNLKYVEIPTILKLRTNEIGYLSYVGQFGFKTGFNYKSSATHMYTFQNPRRDFQSNVEVKSNDSSRDINWIHMSLVIGAGIEYNISGNTSLILGITYNNGFINQLDTKVNVLDANGNALIDSNGNPVYSEKNASANLNYIALNIGIYF